MWNSVVPALAITRGHIWLLSTPFVKEGYYYECFQDPTFTAFHTSSEDCPRRDDAFLEHKKATLTKAQYAQMYLGNFVDELLQLFPDKLIKDTCTLQRRSEIIRGRDYSYGADVARMDKDEFTHEIMDITDKNNVVHVESIVTRDVPLPESTRKIIQLNREYNFGREYIDSGGMGIAVCDMLREDDDNKRKVVEINNASRAYDRGDKQKKLMKEELYLYLKQLMENDKIMLLDDDEVKASLKCIRAEHDVRTGKLKIWGDDSHIVEGMIRAVRGAFDKPLNIYYYS